MNSARSRLSLCWTAALYSQETCCGPPALCRWVHLQCTLCTYGSTDTTTFFSSPVQELMYGVSCTVDVASSLPAVDVAI